LFPIVRIKLQMQIARYILITIIAPIYVIVINVRRKLY